MFPIISLSAVFYFCGYEKFTRVYISDSLIIRSLSLSLSLSLSFSYFLSLFFLSLSLVLSISLSLSLSLTSLSNSLFFLCVSLSFILSFPVNSFHSLLNLYSLWLPLWTLSLHHLYLHLSLFLVLLFFLSFSFFLSSRSTEACGAVGHKVHMPHS